MTGGNSLVPGHPGKKTCRSNCPYNLIDPPCLSVLAAGRNAALKCCSKALSCAALIPAPAPSFGRNTKAGWCAREGGEAAESRQRMGNDIDRCFAQDFPVRGLVLEGLAEGWILEGGN